MKQLLLILSFTLGLATAAQAGFFHNRDDWKDMPLMMKQGYATGLFEATVTEIDDDSSSAILWKDQINACAKKMQIKIMTIVDMIDNYYEDVANWKNSPRVALMSSLNKACF